MRFWVARSSEVLALDARLKRTALGVRFMGRRVALGSGAAGRRSLAALLRVHGSVSRSPGGRGLAADLASEGLTLGLGGAVVMLALALPAFRETSDETG